MQTLLQTALMGALAAALPAIANAQTSLAINNASFEDSTLGTDGIDNDPPGWFRWNSAGAWNPTFAAFPGGGEDGDNVCFVNQGGVIQILAEQLAPNERYTLRVRVGNRADWPMGPFAVHLGSAGGPHEGSITHVTGPSPAPGEWNEIVIHHTTQPGDLNLGYHLTVELSSAGIPGEAAQVIFDDVRMTKGEPLRVPSEFPTIQAAIDAAHPGARIEISSGTYFENINTLGKAITLEGVGPFRPTIDGNSTGTVITCNNGETGSTVIRNLRIVNAGNTGLRALGASPKVELCEFAFNQGFNGGAINVDTNAPETMVIENCLFENNEATWDGGAISAGSDIIVRGCTFTQNTCLNASPTGGAMNFWASHIELESSILWNNNPIEISGSGPGFEVIPRHCNIDGGWFGNGSAMGVGNLDVDPVFVSPISGDYRLSPGSPMIDAGQAFGALDLDLQPRALDDLNVCDSGPGGAPHGDMGAYEFDGTSPHATSNYCSTSLNSSGLPGEIFAEGSLLVSDNSFLLRARDLPNNVPGIFFYGPNQIETPFGNGKRCVGGSLFRLPVVVTGATGQAAHLIDFTNPPLPAGEILPGSNWNFQFWFRDVPGGGAGFNLTNGLNATFCP